MPNNDIRVQSTELNRTLDIYKEDPFSKELLYCTSLPSLKDLVICTQTPSPTPLPQHMPLVCAEHGRAAQYVAILPNSTLIRLYKINIRTIQVYSCTRMWQSNITREPCLLSMELTAYLGVHNVHNKTSGKEEGERFM